MKPGLHFKLPWPCGQIRTFAVKTVRQLPIGFVEEDQPVDVKQPRALLWTRGHAKEEFALVLGGGTELVVVNALLYYKIAEDPRGFMDYVYRQSAQEDTLAAFAYRALMQETRGRTLDEVLSADRGAFSSSLADSVRRQVREARLGLEVVDLALINLHPPIEAAGSYLDVINARLDAHRQVIDAEGKKQVAILTAQTAGITMIANAQIEGSRRVAAAASLAAEFGALSQAYQVRPSDFPQTPVDRGSGVSPGRSAALSYRFDFARPRRRIAARHAPQSDHAGPESRCDSQPGPFRSETP